MLSRPPWGRAASKRRSETQLALRQPGHLEQRHTESFRRPRRLAGAWIVFDRQLGCFALLLGDEEALMFFNDARDTHVLMAR